MTQIAVATWGVLPAKVETVERGRLGRSMLSRQKPLIFVRSPGNPGDCGWRTHGLIIWAKRL